MLREGDEWSQLGRAADSHSDFTADADCGVGGAVVVLEEGEGRGPEAAVLHDGFRTLRKTGSAAKEGE